MTDHFTKRVILGAGKSTWSAQEWGRKWIDLLIQNEWSIPRMLITDRDPLWLSSFFKAVFDKLNTKLLTSTAYHPQTDGQSERTNQTVEIALRFYATTHPDNDWTDALPMLQATLNNSRNSSTGVEPNVVLQGFKNNLDAIDQLAELPREDFDKVRDVSRQEASDALAFAAAAMKQRYDKKHKAVEFKVGQKVMVRLHKGYQLPGETNRKLSHQYQGPFTIKRRVGRLAYELDFPDNPTYNKIHKVVSVAMLEKYPQGEDPYGREPTQPGPLEMEDGGDDSYEIERILAHRTRRHRGGATTQYLIRWVGYGPEHDVWYDESDLDGAEDMLKAYKDTHGVLHASYSA
jgi:hypothetical protein